MKKERTLKYIETLRNDKERIKKDIEEVINYEKGQFKSVLLCKETPSILRQLGLENKPIMMSQRHIRNCTHTKGTNPHWHGLSYELIASIPEHLSRPAMVMDSFSDDYSILVVFSDVDQDNLPIIASINTNGQGIYEVKSVDSNYLTSIYGKENFDNFLERTIEADFLLYVDKEKTQALSSCSKLQLLEAISHKVEFNTIIHKSNNIVNDIDLNSLKVERESGKINNKRKNKNIDEEL